MQQIIKVMINTISTSVGLQDSDLDYKKREVEEFVHACQQIKQLEDEGEITSEQAKSDIEDMKKNLVETLSLTMQGITAIQIQNAVDVAWEIVKKML